MNSLPYLYAAYTVTWLIHAAYIATIVVRRNKLKKQRSSQINQHPTK